MRGGTCEGGGYSSCSLFPDSQWCYLHKFGAAHRVAWALTAWHRLLYGNSFSRASLQRWLARISLISCKDLINREKCQCLRNGKNQSKMKHLLLILFSMNTNTHIQSHTCCFYWGGRYLWYLRILNLCYNFSESRWLPNPGIFGSGILECTPLMDIMQHLLVGESIIPSHKDWCLEQKTLLSQILLPFRSLDG